MFTKDPLVGEKTVNDQVAICSRVLPIFVVGAFSHNSMKMKLDSDDQHKSFEVRQVSLHGALEKSN